MLQINTVLAPVDFSEQTRPSVGHALNLAQHFDAATVLCHAVPSAQYAVAMEGIPIPAVHDEEMEKRLSKQLDALAQEVAPQRDLETVVETGDPVKTIQSVAKEKSADLIVMPTRGYGPFRRFLLGSVTSKVLDGAECPVFTGTHLEDAPPFDPQSIQRVGCAVDLGERSEEVLKWAAEFAASYDAKLTVIHASPSMQAASASAPMVAGSNQELADLARTGLEKLVGKLGADVPVVVESEPIEALIRRVHEEQAIDVLIIGRHNDDGLLGKLQPHAYSIIRESPCPVISV